MKEENLEEKVLERVTDTAPTGLAVVETIIADVDGLVLGERAGAVNHIMSEVTAEALLLGRPLSIAAILDDHSRNRANRSIERMADHAERGFVYLVEFITYFLYGIMAWGLCSKYFPAIDDKNRVKMIAILFKMADVLRNGFIYLNNAIAHGTEKFVDLQMVSRALDFIGITPIVPPVHIPSILERVGSELELKKQDAKKNIQLWKEEAINESKLLKEGVEQEIESLRNRALEEIELLKENTRKEIESLRNDFNEEKLLLKEGVEQEIESLRNRALEEAESLKEDTIKEVESLRNKAIEETSQLEKEIKEISPAIDKEVRNVVENIEAEDKEALHGCLKFGHEVHEFEKKLVHSISSAFHVGGSHSVEDNVHKGEDHSAKSTQKTIVAESKDTKPKTSGGNQASVGKNHCSNEESSQSTANVIGFKTTKPKEVILSVSAITPLDMKVMIKSEAEEYNKTIAEIKERLEETKLAQVQYEKMSNYFDISTLTLVEMGLMAIPFSIIADPLLAVDMKMAGMMM